MASGGGVGRWEGGRFNYLVIPLQVVGEPLPPGVPYRGLQLEFESGLMFETLHQLSYYSPFVNYNI